MAAHRIPLQDFRSNFVDRKILKVDKTPRKIKAALIKGYSVINFPEGTTYFTNHIEFNFGSFAMATKIKAAVILLQ
jgi:1-acyl-sn-glycerol-3-phosphate acyltransferase